MTHVPVLLANSWSVILTTPVAVRAVAQQHHPKELIPGVPTPPSHRCIPGISAAVTDGIQALTCVRAVLPPPPRQPPALRNWDTPLTYFPE